MNKKLFTNTLLMVAGVPMVIVGMGVMLFLPAGSIRWIEGWLIIAVILCYMILTFVYFLIKDPSTLDNRRKMSTEKGDGSYLAAIGITSFAPVLLSAFDYRFGWTQLPFTVSLGGFILSLRIRKEEAMLLRELKGYAEYRKRVKYRLIPKVW